VAGRGLVPRSSERTNSFREIKRKKNRLKRTIDVSSKRTLNLLNRVKEREGDTGEGIPIVKKKVFHFRIDGSERKIER